jgi:hypothetical protein
LPTPPAPLADRPLTAARRRLSLPTMQDGRLIAHLHQPPQLLDLVDDEWRADHLGYGTNGRTPSHAAVKMLCGRRANALPAPPDNLSHAARPRVFAAVRLLCVFR